MKLSNPAIFKNSLMAALFFTIWVSSYLFGAYSYHRNIWPIELLWSIKRQIFPATYTRTRMGTYDDFYRLIQFPHKTEVPCPASSDKTAVFLVIGQSNAANHAEKKFTTRHPDRVFNFFDDSCFTASSPLLGATGEDGEFITLLADKIIDSKTYDRVVII